MATSQAEAPARPSDVWKSSSASPIDLAAHLKRINEAPVLVEGKRRVLKMLLPDADEGRPASGQRLRLLDVGCGLGQDLLRTAQRMRALGLTGEVVGLDFNSTMVAAAKDVLPAYQAEVGDEVKLAVEEGNLLEMKAFADESFDGVSLTLVMQHIAAEDVDKALSELRRVLKPGGQVIFCGPDMDTRTRMYSTDKELIEGLMKMENHVVSFNRSMGLNALYGKLRVMGFRSIKIDALSHVQANHEDTDPGYVKAQAMMKSLVAAGVFSPIEGDDLLARLMKANEKGDLIRTSQMFILAAFRDHLDPSPSFRPCSSRPFSPTANRFPLASNCNP